jgi:hypothetical protein
MLRFRTAERSRVEGESYQALTILPEHPRHPVIVFTDQAGRVNMSASPLLTFILYNVPYA